MKDKNIKVTTGDRHDMAKEFIAAWHQAEAGHIPVHIEEKIYFKDDRALFKVLTPKRCELLRYVHDHGKTAILALAKQLKRDYHNVYQDVKDLSQVGLMVKDDATGKYSVPWHAIVTEIPLSVHHQTLDSENRKTL
jgi:predicted transcriptional regulator